MIRTVALALCLVVPLAAQETAKKPVPKPGWQDRLERATKSPEAWKARRDEVRRQILVAAGLRSEEHTSELQSHSDLVCRLLLEKKKTIHRSNARQSLKPLFNLYS